MLSCAKVQYSDKAEGPDPHRLDNLNRQFLARVDKSISRRISNHDTLSHRKRCENGEEDDAQELHCRDKS